MHKLAGFMYVLALLKMLLVMMGCMMHYLPHVFPVTQPAASKH